MAKSFDNYINIANPKKLLLKFYYSNLHILQTVMKRYCYCFEKLAIVFHCCHFRTCLDHLTCLLTEFKNSKAKRGYCLPKE